MILYLLKITACLAVLIVFYYLWLAGEKMTRFNRFYLLFSLAFAISIPCFQITLSNPVVLPIGESLQFDYTISNLDNSVPTTSVSWESNTYSQEIGWWLYGAGVLVFLTRFGVNLIVLYAKICCNRKVDYRGATLILLNRPTLPHTFLHYIFLNSEAYRNNLIDSTLLEHELSHVQQKHTLDILLIELLQIALWFHPLIYLYRKAMQQNHEYLADESVVNNCENVGYYQQILLDNVLQNNPVHLTSSAGHSFTKKRLRMMTKNTPSPRAFLKKAALVPLLTILAFIFADRTLAQEPVQPKDNPLTQFVQAVELSEKDSLRIVRDRYWSGRTSIIRYTDQSGNKVAKTYDEATDEEKERFFMPKLSFVEKRTPTQNQLNDWLDPDVYGIWLDGKRIDNTSLAKYKPTDFGSFHVSKLAKNAKNYGKHNFQVNLETLAQFGKRNKKFFERLGIDPETMKLIL